MSSLTSYWTGNITFLGVCGRGGRGVSPLQWGSIGEGEGSRDGVVLAQCRGFLGSYIGLDGEKLYCPLSM